MTEAFPDRGSLAPAERAFLESAPIYSEPPPGLASLAPLPAPRQRSRTRSILSKLLFLSIGGAACWVLALAMLRMLGQ